MRGVEYQMLMCAHNRLCARSVTLSPWEKWFRDPQETGMLLTARFVGCAQAGGTQIPVVQHANAVGRTDGSVGGAQCPHPAQMLLHFRGRPPKMTASGARGLRRLTTRRSTHFRSRSHW